jgi:hypothetical protein
MGQGSRSYHGGICMSQVRDLTGGGMMFVQKRREGQGGVRGASESQAEDWG